MSEITTRPPVSRILIVDDDLSFHQRVRYALREHFEFEGVETVEKLWTLLRKDDHFDLILLDLALNPDDDDKTLGLEIIQQLRQKLPNIPILVVTNKPDFESATTAILRGAKDYLDKDSYDEKLWSGKFRTIIKASIARIFISYAREDQKHKETLLTHLKVLEKYQFTLEICEDSQIRHGYKWPEEINRLMHEANVFIFLVSTNLLASDFINDVEIPAALDAHKKYNALIVPILLNRCLWEKSPFENFQKLPTQRRFLSQFRDRNEGWCDVAKGLRDMLEREFPASVRRT